MSPSVSRSAQASASAWEGMNPDSTSPGRPRVHEVSSSVASSTATHRAIAAFSASGGSAMNAASNRAASSAEHPSASSSAARSDPCAAGAQAANSSHTPSAEDTEPAWC